MLLGLVVFLSVAFTICLWYNIHQTNGLKRKFKRLQSNFSELHENYDELREDFITAMDFSDLEIESIIKRGKIVRDSDWTRLELLKLHGKVPRELEPYIKIKKRKKKKYLDTG